MGIADAESMEDIVDVEPVEDIADAESMEDTPMQKMADNELVEDNGEKDFDAPATEQEVTVIEMPEREIEDKFEELEDENDLDSVDEKDLEEHNPESADFNF